MRRRLTFLLYFNMYSLAFSAKNLYSCSNQTERRNSGLDKDELIQKIQNCIGDTINPETFQFSLEKVQNLYLNSCLKRSIEYLCQDLVLRKLYNNIKRIYRVEQSNRNQIVEQMKALLQEETEKWVVRLDVRHFYESINRKKIIEQFEEDGRLNYQSITLLKRLFWNPSFNGEHGLPRGLSISSVMSELYMRDFDLKIRRLEGVFYYARFVDDIIVFCSDQKVQENVWNIVPGMLRRMDLQLNKSKSYKWFSGNHQLKLSYLGYTFTTISKDLKKVDVLIAEKKVNMIKTRITRSFVRFAKDGDFCTLKNRIKFLTGNFTLYNKTTLLPVKVGLYYNYNMITEKKVLYELDEYYQRILHCRGGKLGILLCKRMTATQRKELAKYSFVFGFEKHVNHFFPSEILSRLTECWK